LGPYKNVYTSVEYKQLQELNEAALEQNKILKSQLDKAIGDLAHHAQSIVDLQKEKLRLQQEVDDATRGQKVALPAEVAEAIEECRVQWTGFSKTSVFGWFLSIDKFDSSKAGLTIKEFAKTRPLDYMTALVNGYTIEQTPSEKLTAKVEGLLKEWFDPEGALPTDHIHKATELIVGHAEELIT